MSESQDFILSKWVASGKFLHDLTMYNLETTFIYLWKMNWRREKNESKKKKLRNSTTHIMVVRRDGKEREVNGFGMYFKVITRDFLME